MSESATKTGRRFLTLDVFTGRVHAGNPLAVVLDAEGLTDDAMQAIAGEFNLSETVFVLPPDDPAHRARLRIFTPKQELPFAGHPTVGTAVLLALAGGASADFGLEEQVGIVPCSVMVTGKRTGRATFALPRLPERLGDLPEAETIAAALGLAAGDIGLSGHKPARYSAGTPFSFVPLASRTAVDRVRANSQSWSAAFGEGLRANAFIYCREPLDSGHHYYARMFAPGLGIGEDPATGSAVAAFAGLIMDCDRFADGEHSVVIEQGYAMGRPSDITLTITASGGALERATIGGEVVLVSEGRLLL
ncbi:PhzF family phenazine biosynthesis protein [Chelatococcus sp. GCM10030263]|uniref:PhzF family phenazine biosynthesis protein n=1 Tax=Chelatococcus sp. GCM10030263 TaxID=3273387 RepID=UPI00360EA6D1